MIGGQMYAVVHSDTTLGSELACETLGAACTYSRGVWVVENNPKEVFDSASAVAKQMLQAVERGVIQIFETTGAKLSLLSHILLEELNFLEISKGSLIVIEGADRLLDPDQTETWNAELGAWQRWAESLECVLLWLYPKRAGRTDPERDIFRIMHRFSGYARLSKSDKEMRWDIFHWFGTEGMVTNKSFRLSRQKDGPWQSESLDILPEAMSEAAVDENDVFITYAALAGAYPVPDGWRVMEALDQMISALGNATAATAIIHYNSHTPLDVIARTVFGLRRSNGARIKIAVRETSVRLRHSHKQLLLNVGANLVISSDTSFSTMLSLIETIQGHVYSHSLQDDYESTIANVMPVAQMGYLPPNDFVTTVSEAMDRTRAMSIHNSLIRFPLTPGLGALETLRCCVMKRPGDLCTADDSSVYVFLFACEEQDIGQTLDRLFRIPVSVLFAVEWRYLTSNDIAEAITDLNQRGTESNLPDFTADLAASSNEDSTKTNNPFASSKNARSAVRTVVPAVRRPLILRTKIPCEPLS